MTTKAELQEYHRVPWSEVGDCSIWVLRDVQEMGSRRGREKVHSVGRYGPTCWHAMLTELRVGEEV